MPTKRVPAFRCGTYFSGWLDGAHPSVEDGEVSRMICFSDREHGCRYRTQTSVKNCGSYFIYKLNPDVIVPYATVVQTDFEANALHVMEDL